MYMRLTQREKEMADMFEQMSKDEQEIMIEFAKRLRTEDPKELVKEINQRLDINVFRFVWLHRQLNEFDSPLFTKMFL